MFFRKYYFQKLSKNWISIKIYWGAIAPPCSAGDSSHGFIYVNAEPISRLTWCVIGISPNSLVALVGPHSPLAQSGNGTITVCNSSQAILNLQTLLNFIGSPVRYSLGVTALAKMSNRNAPLLGACTRNATMFPTTDCERVRVMTVISRPMFLFANCFYLITL